MEADNRASPTPLPFTGDRASDRFSWALKILHPSAKTSEPTRTSRFVPVIVLRGRSAQPRLRLVSSVSADMATRSRGPSVAFRLPLFKGFQAEGWSAVGVDERRTLGNSAGFLNGDV